MSNKKLYWWKSIVSMGVILGSMPMVHLVARVLKDNYDGTQLLGAGMAVGFVGLVMVVVGVFVNGQTRQTLLGLIGGMFYWTGWVDFLFMYYAHRWGTHAEIDPTTGEVLSRPEYLLLPATFGLWAMVMLLYIFCSRNACNFLNWWQTLFLGEEQATHRRSPDDTPHQHCYLHGNQHNALDLLSPADEPLRSSIVWS